MDINKYLSSLKRIYEAHADPGVAIGMQKYMRDQFTCYGIYNPQRKELHKEFFAENGLPSEEDLAGITKALWEKPQRDFQYFGMILLTKSMKKADQQRIDLYEYMISNKSWWDTVDYIASWLVGQQFQLYPELVHNYTKKWMASSDMWLQRTCIIYQLKYKHNTDTSQITSFIEALSDSKEFFIRKAIGWALREYSKTNPDWVRSFIESHKLAPLSSREGMKWILAKGL